jgi:hypothetical protein
MISNNLHSKRTTSQQPEFNVDQKLQKLNADLPVLNPEVEVYENVAVD